MDIKTSRIIQDTPLVIVDFDRTLVTLDVDWEELKQNLASLATKNHAPWTATKKLDLNLGNLRNAGLNELYAQFCELISQAEIEGFKTKKVNLSFVDQLLKRNPKPVAIFSSNTRRAIKEITSTPPLSDLNAYIVAKEDVVRGKPSPDGLLAICNRFSMQPKDCIFIGDSGLDFEAGKQAGILTLDVARFNLQKAPPSATHD